MPQRLMVLANLIEVIALTFLNVVMFITWISFFTFIPLFISSIYGIGRIKRDIEKYHNGKSRDYLKFILGIGKKK